MMQGISYGYIIGVQKRIQRGCNICITLKSQIKFGSKLLKFYSRNAIAIVKIQLIFFKKVHLEIQLY